MKETNEEKKLELNLQANNIDQEGNVLFLDEERLARKVTGLPRFENSPNGLGIYNFIKEHVLIMNQKRWPLTHKLYHIFIKFSPWLKKGGWGSRLYKKIVMISPDMEKHTSIVTLPLNVDLTDQAEKTVVPMDLIKASLKGMEFIAGMDTCLCRDSNGCEDYPVDVACLFLGDGGRAVVKQGLAKELTYEEACARVDKAAEYGLMGQAVWVEVEHLIWGVRNDQMDKFLEICFCCPCCCLGMRLARNATPAERFRFHPSGWTAVADQTKCTGCGLCQETHNGCPMEAISFGEHGKVVINQELCLGCGICKNRCPVDAIQIKQTMPMRKDLHEYFLKDFNIDLKLWDKQ